jgi:hypothetical protein
MTVDSPPSSVGPSVAPVPERRPPRGGAVALLGALVLGAIAFLPRITRAEELVTAQVGLTEVPEVDVARFPLGDAIPVPMPELPQGRLRIESLSGELVLDVVPFDKHGEPIGEAFEAINHAFRARNDDEVRIHPRLVELLITLSNAFDERPITLVSAHRSPGAGTSKTSYHVRGMAADILIRGVKVQELRKAAVRLGALGIGVYPSFLHVDVRDDRPPYRWAGGSWRPWRRR